MPTIRIEHVVLKIDTGRFVAEMRRAREQLAALDWSRITHALRAFDRALDKRPDHHVRELPQRSAMHAAYDRRRRARRRRNRR